MEIINNNLYATNVIVSLNQKKTIKIIPKKITNRDKHE